MGKCVCVCMKRGNQNNVTHTYTHAVIMYISIYRQDY